MFEEKLAFLMKQEYRIHMIWLYCLVTSRNYISTWQEREKVVVIESCQKYIVEWDVSWIV